MSLKSNFSKILFGKLSLFFILILATNFNSSLLKFGYKKKEIDFIHTIKKEHIILSSIITVKYGDKVWTIHGGNSNILRELNSNYLLYYEIIKDAHEEGYKIVDFFLSKINHSEEIYLHFTKNSKYFY